jgi:hypothetical protein
MEPSKVPIAQVNLGEAGLSHYVEIPVWDAQQTLADPGRMIDLLLIDGYKDLYVPIAVMLTPYLHAGRWCLAIMMKASMASYLSFVNDAKNGFYSLTIPFQDGIEYSIGL